MRFDNVVNHLVRKRGDVMTGDLTLKGYATLFTHSIQGYPEDETDSSLKLNFNSEDKVYVNGDNPVLDLRDFTTKLDWEPKAQTIPDKEANDKRLVMPNIYTEITRLLIVPLLLVFLLLQKQQN